MICGWYHNREGCKELQRVKTVKWYNRVKKSLSSEAEKLKMQCHELVSWNEAAKDIIGLKNPRVQRRKSLICGVMNK